MNSFDMYISKINFKKLKIYIILTYFQVKNILKSNIYQTPENNYQNC